MALYTFAISGVSERDRHMGGGFEDHLDMLFDGFEDEEDGGIQIDSRGVHLLHSLVVSVEADDEDEAEEKIEDAIGETGITPLNIQLMREDGQ